MLSVKVYGMIKTIPEYKEYIDECKRNGQTLWVNYGAYVVHFRMRNDQGFWKNATETYMAEGDKGQHDLVRNRFENDYASGFRKGRVQIVSIFYQ
jgi:hypothetical protein